jgi:HD-GYP domain-containing protein (c-di-GMP phosphodiesterase class II)
MAGVIAALSVTSDLTRGHPVGEAMRACLLATELARRAGVDPEVESAVYYATLMRFAGCTATSHEAALRLGGDDIVVRARGDLIDATRPSEALRFVAGLGSGLEKLRVLAQIPRMPGIVAEAARADCEVGADLAERLALPESVRASVLCAFERYDGKGSPSGLTGDQLALPARYAAVGYTAVMFAAIDGRDLAVSTIERWSGRALDPQISALFLAAPDELLRLSDPDDLWSGTVAAEPTPPRTFRDDGHLDEVLAGFADAADLKAPFFHGHSRGVATLARDTAAAVGVDPGVAYRAGLLHDLGRVAVPTGVWERPGPLRPEEWELVRMYPYHSGRILARSDALAPLAPIVSRHHERLDGSGYPAGMAAAELDMTMRLLAAADVWRSLGEPRPHRPAQTFAQAAEAIGQMALDRDAVRAVMTVAGAPRSALPPLPVRLTDREIEVLRLLADGLTKRQIADRLFVSASTVHTHTVHIYEKCQVSTRAGLAMFAMRHGLCDPAWKAEKID